MICPHCNIKINLYEIRCGILRCGIYRLKNGKIKQLPKHGKKKTINKIKKENRLLFGCGNPIKYKNGTFIKTSWDS